MKAKELRAMARNDLKSKWGKGAIITLAFFLVTWLIAIVYNIFVSTPIAIIGILLYIAVLPPIGYSIAVQFFKLSKGEQVKAFDFVDWSISNFTKSWKVSLQIIKKLLLPIILFIVSIVFVVFSTVAGTAEMVINGPTSVLVQFTGLLLIALIGYLVCIIWLMVKSIYYAMVAYIMADNSELTAKEIVEKSQELMKEHRWKLFCLGLSFIGWAILSVFTLGIGLFFLIPYMQVSFAEFYKERAGSLTSTSKEETVQAPIE